MCLLNCPPFQHCHFLFCNDSTFSSTQCILSACNVSSHVSDKQTHNVSQTLPTHLSTNFCRQPQASAVSTLRHCSPKGVNMPTVVMNIVRKHCLWTVFADTLVLRIIKKPLGELQGSCHDADSYEDV